MNQVQNKMMTYKSLLSVTLVEMIDTDFFKIAKNFLDPVSMARQLIESGDIDQFYTLAQASGNPLSRVIQQADINQIYLAGQQWYVGDPGLDVEISTEPIIQAYSLFKSYRTIPSNPSKYITPPPGVHNPYGGQSPWGPMPQGGVYGSPYTPPHAIQPSGFITWLIATQGQPGGHSRTTSTNEPH